MSNDAFAARGQGAADWLADHPIDDLALLRPYVDPDHQQEFDALIEALRTVAPQDDREAEIARIAALMVEAGWENVPVTHSDARALYDAGLRTRPDHDELIEAATAFLEWESGSNMGMPRPSVPERTRLRAILTRSPQAPESPEPLS